MNHLKNLLEGARQVLVLDSGAQYIRPSNNGFARDHSVLKEDSKRVISDLSKTTKARVKQVNASES